MERHSLQLKIEVPRAEVPRACTALLAGGTVSDLSVKEVPIEEVIRRVFGEQQEEHKMNMELMNSGIKN